MYDWNKLRYEYKAVENIYAVEQHKQRRNKETEELKGGKQHWTEKVGPLTYTQIADLGAGNNKVSQNYYISPTTGRKLEEV